MTHLGIHFLQRPLCGSLHRGNSAWWRMWRLWWVPRVHAGVSLRQWGQRWASASLLSSRTSHHCAGGTAWWSCWQDVGWDDFPQGFCYFQSNSHSSALLIRGHHKLTQNITFVQFHLCLSERYKYIWNTSTYTSWCSYCVIFIWILLL